MLRRKTTAAAVVSSTRRLACVARATASRRASSHDHTTAPRFDPKRPLTKYWALSEPNPRPNAANLYISKALEGMSLPEDVQATIDVTHPTAISCFQAVPFILGDKGSLQEMSAYYRRMLRRARPASEVLADMEKEDQESLQSAEMSAHTHLNAGRALLSFVVANTGSGPKIQRYMLFPYNSLWNDVTSVNSQFARRQIAAVWASSMLGCARYVTKTNAIEHDGRTVVTRRFIEGVDLPKFIECEGVPRLASDILTHCDDPYGLLQMTLLKTASNPLDLHNAHNVVIPGSSEVAVSRVVSIDHELEFPSRTMCGWFAQRNPHFQWDPKSPHTAIPRCFAWRCKQGREMGRAEFARAQLELGSRADFLDGHPYANLLLVRNGGDIDKTLAEALPPDVLRRMLAGLPMVNRVFELLDISRFSRESFNDYMAYCKRFVEQGKPMTLADMLAPEQTEEEAARQIAALGQLDDG